MAHNYLSHKMIRRNMKKDDLREMIDAAVHFAKTNTENLLITLIIVGVVAVLVPMYFRHQAENEMRAANTLDRALSYTLQPVNAAGSSPGQSFKSREEKYKKSLEAYGEVSNAYRSTRSAGIARLGEAQSLFFLKEYSQAQGVFREELEKHAGDEITPDLKTYIGACQENQGKWQEALTTYQEVLSRYPGYFNRPWVRLAMARCQLKLGKTDEAKKLLEEQQAADPGSFWSETARRQLAVFEAALKP